PPPPRPISGTVPTARHGDGKALPRAYVARRRQSTPRGNPVVPPNAADETNEATPTASNDAAPNSSNEALHAAPTEPASTETSASDSAVGADMIVAAAANTEVQSTTAPIERTAPAVHDVSIESSPSEFASSGAHSDDGHTASGDEGAPPPAIVDIDQLHLEGMTPPISDRLPIFTPAPMSPPAAQPSATPTASPSVAPQARAHSRIVMYVLVA